MSGLIKRVTLLAVSATVLIASGCQRPSDNYTPAKDPEMLARERGQQIISEYLKRDAAPYRRTRVRITVNNANDSSQVYELEVRRRQTADETLTFTQIVQPAADRNLASLTIEPKGSEATNVTYNATTDQFRETGTDKSFFGGVPSQEFLGEWDKYDFTLLNEKQLAGVTAYELAGQLKPKRDSIIARLTVLVRSDTYLPAEMHAFNSKGEELRTFRMTDYRTFDGRAVISRMEIANHVFKTTVIVEILKMEFPARLDDSLFTREHLKKLASE